MSDTGQEQTEGIISGNTGASASEPGDLRVGESSDPTPEVMPVPNAELEAKIPASRRTPDRTGTVEHLAARRAVTPLQADAPEVKQRLGELRPEFTTLVTDLRWGDASVQETMERIIPLLNVGSVPLWAPVLIPYLLEIDRAGNLVPVWLKVIEQEDQQELSPEANPAETSLGRASRFAILMLGNYKTPDISQALGKLATDPHTSLYATQSLIKQSTTAAMQELVSALKDAEGWAKVDIVEACLALKQARFNDILLASGLDRVAGLESYIAVPIFRSIALEHYLRGGNDITPRLSQQAALILSQVLHDSMKMKPTGDVLPIIFERNLSSLARALFEGARSTPNWQNVLAVHRLATMLGRYWSDISRGAINDPRILEPVYATLPMMNEVERWMNSVGRDVLLETLTSSDAEAFSVAVKTLGELREPRAIPLLVRSIESTASIISREQALQVGYICDTLGRLGDRRALQPLLQLANRSVNAAQRTTRPKRRDNLPPGDADIPGSIVYAAIIRALGQLNDRTTLDFVSRAANDFDPYVRTEVLEAVKRLDPTGTDTRSQQLVREALNDPRDSVVRLASQMVAQYRDVSAVPALHGLSQARPEVAPAAQDALRQLGQ
ncbi:MAG: HEAT repeat domain-containing protein [Ktedonobacteraceae bacterium]